MKRTLTKCPEFVDHYTEMHREAYDNRFQDINQCELGFDDDIPF